MVVIVTINTQVFCSVRGLKDKGDIWMIGHSHWPSEMVWSLADPCLQKNICNLFFQKTLFSKRLKGDFVLKGPSSHAG